MNTTLMLNDMTLAAVEESVVRTAAQLQSEEEFRLFYERTSRPVWAYLARLTGDRQAADDLLQETYYRFYRASASYEGEHHRRNALFTIATNLSRDAHRRRKGVEVSTLDEGFVSNAQQALEVETRTDLTRALDQIPAQQREMLLLAYAYGSSHDEIASAVGVSSGSVKSLLYRARRRLAAILSAAAQNAGGGRS